MLKRRILTIAIIIFLTFLNMKLIYGDSAKSIDKVSTMPVDSKATKSIPRIRRDSKLSPKIRYIKENRQYSKDDRIKVQVKTYFDTKDEEVFERLKKEFGKEVEYEGIGIFNLNISMNQLNVLEGMEEVLIINIFEPENEEIKLSQEIREIKEYGKHTNRDIIKVRAEVHGLRYENFEKEVKKKFGEDIYLESMGKTHPKGEIYVYLNCLYDLDIKMEQLDTLENMEDVFKISDYEISRRGMYIKPMRSGPKSIIIDKLNIRTGDGKELSVINNPSEGAIQLSPVKPRGLSPIKEREKREKWEGDKLTWKIRQMKESGKYNKDDIIKVLVSPDFDVIHEEFIKKIKESLGENIKYEKVGRKYELDITMEQLDILEAMDEVMTISHPDPEDVDYICDINKNTETSTESTKTR
ncbi:hypothetical protein KQI42_10935 [Tissierella sp. MSJ-40]|uniref:Uncharacterized protein n=1 Tax=Tissierella simiarum TaxID=2841534 RepID=A0ABS6E6G9_9FIRM|nr:hypothetical protein [Tissierella simiarum]MBU5438528.1 hypothetical protein [Tissierella simiarum]